MEQLPAEEYAHRRQQLAQMLGDNAAFLLCASPEHTRSHDTPHAYRPSSDLRYLTGILEPEVVLLFLPQHPTHEYTVFLRPRDPNQERWMGRRLGPEGAREHHNADTAYPLSELDAVLPDLLKGRERLYHALGEDTDFDARVQGWLSTLRRTRNKPHGAPTQWHNPRDVLHQMRLRKSPREIDIMREVARLSSEAHEIAMRVCKPGMNEHELEAAMTFHLHRSGVREVAYPSIVGAGANAVILHYTENNAAIQPDDLVLIDAGGELHGYAADITRTFPANGTFNPTQRALYQSVLDAQNAIIELCTPGRRYDEITQGANTVLTQALLDLGLLQGSLPENLEAKHYQRYYPHSFGHWLGMDVHDPCPYFDAQGSWQTLEPGMVVTIEPGLYIPVDDPDAPAEFRGLGVRIEDDILITEDGFEILTHMCPKTIEDVEAIVGSGWSLNL